MTKLQPWRELAAFSVLLMNLAWIAPWPLLFARSALVVAEWHVYLILAAIALLAYALGRITWALNLKTKIQIALVAICMVVSLLIADNLILGSVDNPGASLNRTIQGWGEAVSMIPAQILIGGVIMIVWWRCLRLARQQVGPIAVRANFRLGIVILLILGLLFSRLEEKAQPMGIYLSFLMAGLMAMAAARVGVMDVFARTKQNPFDRRWLSQMALAMLSFVGIASLVGVYALGQMDRLSLWLQNAVYFVGLVLFSPFILLASLLSALWGQLSSVAPQLPPPEITPEPVEEPLALTADRVLNTLQHGGPDLLTAFKFVLQWGAVFLVVFLVFWFLRRLLLRSWGPGGDDTGSDSYESLGDVGRLLRQALLGEARQVVAGVSKRLNRGERLVAAAHIRRIYRQLLDLSRDLGIPRRASQTPWEFVRTLNKVFNTTCEDIDTITAAYVRVRYGEYPETQDQVDAVDKAWLRVRAYAELRARETGEQARLPQPGIPH